LKIPSSILLVLTGVALALIPGLPAVEMAPEFVLLVVLPPIVYSSAVAMSWREFRFNLRPISLLAVGCVLFTTAATAAATAAATHFLLGLAWPVGFVLGAIVSPPDPVAPLAIARRLQVPRRLLVILEGEGLANDATALVVYRFAVGAAGVGAFSLGDAVGEFAAIVAGEILWGIGVGWLMLRLRRWVGDPRIEITLSILTPFLAFWPPAQIGGSGVLATITAGLYISWNGLRLISAATRLQGIFFWDFLIYLIEGMVFLVTGLQARSVIAGIRDYSVSELAISAALVTAVVIVARFVWLYPATYLPRWLFPAVRRSDPSPPWQWPFALASAGVRGVVSRGGAGDPVRYAARPVVSRTRSHPVSDLLRHFGDARRPGPVAALDHTPARTRACRAPGTARRPDRGTPGAPAGGGSRDRKVRAAGDRKVPVGRYRQAAPRRPAQPTVANRGEGRRRRASRQARRSS